MSVARPTVETVLAVKVPNPLPPAIARPKEHVEAVLGQSLLEMGEQGRGALAWAWALTGTRPSPVTLSAALGRPPTREEMLAEADADPEGSTAPTGVPSNFWGQLGETRRILAWLAGGSDEIPVDDDNRGRFIGARDDYARTDEEIRQIRDHARHGLDTFELPDAMDPAEARHPWRWDVGWMNAAWLRGLCDLLDWVLGDRAASPLSGRTADLLTTYDLTYEESTATDVALQGRPSGLLVDPCAYPPPQYGEAIQAAIRWLRGETTTAPVDCAGSGPYGPASTPLPDDLPK
jgi:hypothetical protein